LARRRSRFPDRGHVHSQGLGVVAVCRYSRYGGATRLDIEARVFRCRDRRPVRRALPALLAAGLAACAAPPAPPANPFVGTWATADNDTVTLRQDTVVENQPNGRSTPLDRSTCNGTFSFGYAVWRREALTGLLPRQPNLAQNLSELLVAPTYPVALLRCDQGDHTYVMLNDRELVAIYRDGDIGVVERLARR
jgi:hypothetical protein